MAFDLAAVNQQLANDPQWQALVRDWQQHGARFGQGGKFGVAYSAGLQPFRDYLQSKGIVLPNDVAIVPANGTLDQSWTNSTGGALGLSALEYAAMFGGAYGATALGAGGGAAAPVLGDGTTVATNLGGASALGTPTVAGGAAATAPGLVQGGAGAFDAAGNWVAGSQAANPATFAGGSGAFSTFANSMLGRDLAGGGLSLLGSYLASRAQGQASDAQIAQEQRALAAQVAMFNQNTGLNVQQANQTNAFNVGQSNLNTGAYNTALDNLNPYRATGLSAANLLTQGLPGYNAANYAYTPSPHATPLVVPPITAPPPLTLADLTGAGTPTTPTPAPVTDPRAAQTPQQQASQQSASSVAARPGEQRMINGQLAQYDGTGWRAVQQQGAA